MDEQKMTLSEALAIISPKEKEYRAFARIRGVLAAALEAEGVAKALQGTIEKLKLAKAELEQAVTNEQSRLESARRVGDEEDQKMRVRTESSSRQADLDLAERRKKAEAEALASLNAVRQKEAEASQRLRGLQGRYEKERVALEQSRVALQGEIGKLTVQRDRAKQEIGDLAGRLGL